MLKEVALDQILFLDIETVSQYETYDNVPEKFQRLWDKKSSFISKDEDATPEELYPRAAIYAEFGKIVCISVGFVNGGEVRLKSFYGLEEKPLLEEFSQLLNRHFNQDYHKLCAHNGKEFDFPYIARRLLINGLPIPKILNLHGVKPWNVPHLDTMEMWKFGDYKNYTSLELLAAVFDIPTPKDDIDGSQVGAVFWKEKDIERIKEYCQKDVLTTMRLFQAYRGEPFWKDEQVTEVD
jgi:DNA polymerase elongation subunit (family B)